ncbi:hypothetical protein ACFFU9_08365 [Mariniflexile ostreae]|uniref:Cell surface protein n=1 Tax=Mariniflexile ostreae TaxID=1520892 RepID=A0ABV5FCD1_9FLAO
MKRNQNFLIAAFLGFALVLSSCSEDDSVEILEPQIAMSIEENTQQLSVGDSMVFSAVNQNNAVYEEKWSLGDNVVSNTNTYLFEPTHSGDYKLYYEASNATTTFNYEYTIHVAAKIRPITEASNAYVSQLIEYLPAPGQFINKNPGNIASAESIIGKKGSVTLGAWGGAVSYAFDHTVINNADEDDFIIYGNASSTFSEPGVIYVMQDENANGLADDTWYEIKGSAHAEEGTLRDYKVTYFRPETVEGDVAWEDNKGNTGVVLKSAFHKQAYYPEWITEDSYTISGTLLSDMNIDRSNPSMITSAPFDYGYADNTPGGDKINIADAVDEAGNAVHLSGIDFIKIQTGIQANMGWLGELSTEVAGVADLSLLN